MDAVEALLRAAAEREARGEGRAQPAGSNHAEARARSLAAEYYSGDRVRERRAVVKVHGTGFRGVGSGRGPVVGGGRSFARARSVRGKMS